MANRPPAMVGDLGGGGGQEVRRGPDTIRLPGQVNWLPDWSGGSLWAIELGGGDGVPLEVQPPVESAPDDG